MPEEKKEISKAQRKAVSKYVKKNYDKISLMVPKGERANIAAAASAVGESTNGYIKEAIKRRMSSGD